MDRLIFEDYEDFICKVNEDFELVKRINKCNDVSIIAKYDEARFVLRELMSHGYVPRTLEFSHSEREVYEDEYIITVVNLEGDDEVWCEPFHRESGYINDESVIIYILDNCSSKVIPHCKGNIVYEVCIENYSECDCENKCVGCDCSESTDLDILKKLRLILA